VVKIAKFPEGEEMYEARMLAVPLLPYFDQGTHRHDTRQRTNPLCWWPVHDSIETSLIPYRHNVFLETSSIEVP